MLRGVVHDTSRLLWYDWDVLTRLNGVAAVSCAPGKTGHHQAATIPPGPVARSMVHGYA
jgi:hypothetical protein